MMSFANVHNVLSPKNLFKLETDITHMNIYQFKNLLMMIISDAALKIA